MMKAKQRTQIALRVKLALPWDPHTDSFSPPGELHSSLDFPYPMHVPGTVIRQAAYNSFVPFQAKPTIRFSKRGKPGIRLQDALERELIDMDNPNLRSSLTHSSLKVLIRINVRFKPAMLSVLC